MVLIVLLFILESVNSYVTYNEFNLLEEYFVPKRFWLYWEGPLQNLTKFCFHQLKNNVLNYEIVLLDNNTVRSYINSSDFPSILYNLPQANQGDYYRFNILSQFGGIWIDASTYVKNDSVIDGLLKEMYEKKAELLAFNFMFHPMNNIELGVILCPVNSEFIKKVCYIYVYGLKTERGDLMKKMINEGMVLNATYQYNINNNTGKTHYSYYYFSYYCVQYVLQIQYKSVANIIIKKAEEWSYKLQTDYKWNREIMSEKLNEVNGLDEYKIIKFNGGNRKYLKIPFDEII